MDIKANLRLKFSNPDIENAYQLECSKDLSFQSTFGISLALVLYILFAVLDIFITPEYLSQIWKIRAAVVVFFALAIIFIHSKYFIRFNQEILIASSLVCMGGLFYMFAIIPPVAEGRYYVALMLVIPWMYMVLGLKIANAFILNIILLAIYNFEIAIIKNYDIEIIINNNFFLIGSSFMAIIGGYIIDRSKRITFSANRAKSQFYSNMSHELRTPLNIILGYSDLLKEDISKETDEGQHASILAIQASGFHLLKLINDILDLSKIESGKLDLSIQHFSLESFIDQLNVTSMPLALKNDNKIFINSPKIDVELSTDYTKLMQIMLNLISNACKFTKNGNITITVSDDEKHLSFAIKDTGIGMTESQLQNIFLEFRQADASITGTYGGTGLGLTISKKLAVLLGGDIYVSSSINQGSEFVVKTLKTL